MPQTTTQIFRCLILGKYTAAVVEDGHLEVQGPQPLAGPLPDSIKARREELIEFLNEWADGVWQPSAGSGLRDLQEIFDCSLAGALDVVERARRGAAA
jgi:hypothetical protein